MKVWTVTENNRIKFAVFSGISSRT